MKRCFSSDLCVTFWTSGTIRLKMLPSYNRWRWYYQHSRWRFCLSKSCLRFGHVHLLSVRITYKYGIQRKIKCPQIGYLCFKYVLNIAIEEGNCKILFINVHTHHSWNLIFKGFKHYCHRWTYTKRTTSSNLKYPCEIVYKPILGHHGHL